jgi:transposase
VKEAVPAAHRDKPLEIWFQDEARIGQKGTLTRVWARIGSRPRAPRDSRYEWAYIFGAICPERATGVGLVLPYANREAMNRHLAEIGRAVTPGAHGVLVLDGAGGHTSPALAVPDNLTLVCLPAYAPELNPAENIWDYLRKNKLAIRVYGTYDAILDACCRAWNDLLAMPARLVSITTRDWATV